MSDQKKMKAIGMMLARIARRTAQEEGTAANEVIDMIPLLKPWSEGAYEAGEVRVYGGYPYKCVQAHDSTDNESWNPAEAPSLWASYHATDAAHALPWVQPTGAHDAYQTGEYMSFMDIIYRCVQDGVVHDPTVLPQAWEEAS